MTEKVVVGFHEVLEALGNCIEKAPLPERAALQAALSGYEKTFPEDFYWAIGVQAPTMLHEIMIMIDHAATCLCEEHLKEVSAQHSAEHLKGSFKQRRN